MQTANINIDGIYAFERQGLLVRFKVTEIITRKISKSGKAEATIVGYIMEDHAEGKNPERVQTSPNCLLGPYANHLELIKRQQDEAEAKQEKERQQNELALADRLRLYKFVDAPAPRNPEDYVQLFRVRYGHLTITNEGGEAIIEIIRRMAL